jgi:putative CocE/NonD family hydrolase
MNESLPPAGKLGVITERDVAMVMRDGVTLRAHVYRPDSDGRFPALFIRTPYGKGDATEPPAMHQRFVRAGYAVIHQDTRGRYASDGDFQLFSVENTGDGEDGFDSIEWIAEQPWCDGKVGTFGASYNAWMQWQAAKLRPPHLVAMCAYTIPLELTEVDYTGSFRLARRFMWWLTTIAPDFRRRAGMTPPHTPADAREIWHEIEHGRWLYMLPLSDIVKHLPPAMAAQASDWLNDPARRPWRFDEVHKQIDVPNLDFSGWYDHCNGSIGHLALMQRDARTETARTQTKMILGPWSHPTIGQRKIGDIDFGPLAQVDLTDVMIRWFDHWIKGVSNGMDREPPVRYFVMGSGQWKQTSTWPPPNSEPRDYFLDGDALTNAAPAKPSTRGYDYDPQNPVPTLWDRTLFTTPSDRNQLIHRNDILRYRTPPLACDVEIAGKPSVVLHVSSTAPDTDFFARLVDEHPDDGPARDICYGMTRLRHRRGLDRNDPTTPGETIELRIELGHTACRFLAGHRIQLEITSSDFPNHDRNHNTGGNDLFETNMQPATQTIHAGGEHASKLVLPCFECG